MRHATWMFEDGASARRVLLAGLVLCLFSGCGGPIFNRGTSGTVYAPPAYGAAPTYAYQQQPVMSAQTQVVQPQVVQPQVVQPTVVAAPPQVIAAAPQVIQQPVVQAQCIPQQQYVQPAAYYQQQGNACCACPCQ